jgi:mannose-6-phosphate isomerase-like protein (cupin superfamily)
MTSAVKKNEITGVDEEIRNLAVVGDVVRILVGSADTGGAFAMIEEVSPPGGGPPPHIHQNEDEGFYVIEGDVEFLLGDRWVRAGAGASLFGPRGVPHTFRNVGSKPSRVLATIAPGGFERFFEDVDRMAQSGPPTPEALIALGKRYRLEFLPPGGAP